MCHDVVNGEYNKNLSRFIEFAININLKVARLYN